MKTILPAALLVLPLLLPTPTAAQSFSLKTEQNIDSAAMPQNLATKPYKVALNLPVLGPNTDAKGNWHLGASFINWDHEKEVPPGILEIAFYSIRAGSRVLLGTQVSNNAVAKAYRYGDENISPIRSEWFEQEFTYCCRDEKYETILRVKETGVVLDRKFSSARNNVIRIRKDDVIFKNNGQTFKAATWLTDYPSMKITFKAFVFRGGKEVLLSENDVLLRLQRTKFIEGSCKGIQKGETLIVKIYYWSGCGHSDSDTCLAAKHYKIYE